MAINFLADLVKGTKKIISEVEELDMAGVLKDAMEGVAEQVGDAVKGTPVGKLASKTAINIFANRTQPRPRPYSLWSEVPKPEGDRQGPVSNYTSWPSLTDRSWLGRHLPPADQEYVDSLPEIEDVLALFKRGQQIDSEHSSGLFPFFAQWFTDSFLRTATPDRRRNTSNHEIDLCQIYGLTEETANILRDKDRKKGKLKSQIIHGEEFPDHLYEKDGAGNWKVKEQYLDLPYVANGKLEEIVKKFPEERKANWYATGLERGNSSIGYTAMSTLFLREHNRICDVLRKENPDWDDERFFQTARMINIVLLLKVVVEDYIVHISGRLIPFEVDTAYPESQPWYRPHWIALEFDLLYRWHSLVLDSFTLKGTTHFPSDYMANNKLLEESGLGAVIQEASSQPAGRIGLQNTPYFLVPVEKESIKMSREFKVKSFNDYREQFQMDRLKSIDDLTQDPTIRHRLHELYDHDGKDGIDRLEFSVGLFAEEGDSSTFGELLTTMVASDAFTQALTNPLLSKNIFNEKTFTKYGLKLIKETSSLKDVAKRNVPQGDQLKVSLTLEAKSENNS